MAGKIRKGKKAEKKSPVSSSTKISTTNGEKACSTRCKFTGRLEC